jgi:hypothetical protein
MRIGPELTAMTIHSSDDLSQMLHLARGSGRYLIVDVGTSATLDPIPNAQGSPRGEIESWLSNNAVVVPVGPDSGDEVARTLCIRAFPTLIAFKAGRERERLVKPNDAAAVLCWLTELEVCPAQHDVGLKHSAATILLSERSYEEATAAYAWLWNNIPGCDRASMGVRISFMAQDIASLISADKGASALFEEIRDASEAAATAYDPKGWFGPRVDWVTLNGTLHDTERTVTWFSQANSDPACRPVIDHVASLLLEPLKERRRWADVGRLFTDPTAKLLETHRALGLADMLGPQRLGEERFSTVKRVAGAQFRETVLVLYSGLIAAGRVSEASKLRSEAIRLDQSDEMRTVLENAPISYN